MEQVRKAGEWQWAIRPLEYLTTIPVVADGLVLVGSETRLMTYQATN